MNRRLIALSGLTLAASAVFFAPRADAANDAMIELLKVLKDQGTITPEAYEQLKGAAQADDEQNTAGQSEIKQAAETLPKIETKEKLEISTPDGAFKWRIGGRLHTDAAFYNNDNGNRRTPRPSPAVSTSGAPAWPWRRPCIAHWQLKFEYDFAGNDTDVDEGIRDAYLRYLCTAGWPLSITVGQYKEYLGLESITSSNDISFMERALPSRTFNDIAGGSDGRRIGVGVHTYGNDLWTASAGIFGPNAAGTTGDNEDSRRRVRSDHLRRAPHLVARPYGESRRAPRLCRLLAQPRRYRPGTVSAQRPEMRVGADRLVDTGNLATDDVNRFGAEAAGVYGPFSLQGEYLWATNSGTDVDPDSRFPWLVHLW